jgi:glycogen debranching enzyme
MNGAEEMCRAVQSLMKSNQVESGGYRYTRPAPSTYEQQWLWDSCFHAIIYCHIDPEMAKDELRSLLNHRGVETDGMIPHMIYWAGGGEELWGREYISAITQPPMIAYVALMVYKVTGDEEFLHEVYSPMWKYYDWLLKERDHDGDYLLTIIHPWESGWDASPRWDDLLGLSDPTDDEARQARFALAHKLKGVGYDMSGVIQENLFHVEPVDFNAIYSANTLALARIAAIIGRQDHEVYFKTIAHKVAAAIRAKMWDERAGSYWDLAGIHEKPIEIPTPASFITLFAEIPPRTQADRLIDQMLTHFSHYRIIRFEP